MSKALLTEIKKFLRETGMGPSHFGKVAVGNSELVARLERGRTVQLDTAERVQAFMAERRAEMAKPSRSKVA